MVVGIHPGLGRTGRFGAGGGTIEFGRLGEAGWLGGVGGLVEGGTVEGWFVESWLYEAGLGESTRLREAAGLAEATGTGGEALACGSGGTLEGAAFLALGVLWAECGAGRASGTEGTVFPALSGPVAKRWAGGRAEGGAIAVKTRLACEGGAGFARR